MNLGLLPPTGAEPRGGQAPAASPTPARNSIRPVSRRSWPSISTRAPSRTRSCRCGSACAARGSACADRGSACADRGSRALRAPGGSIARRSSRRCAASKLNRMAFPATRLRRLRKTGLLRGLVRETELSVAHLVYPMFVVAGIDARDADRLDARHRPPLDRGAPSRRPARLPRSGSPPCCCSASRRQGRAGLRRLGRRGHRPARRRGRSRTPTRICS